MGKKWIALLMAAAMVFSLGMTAFAEEAVEEEEEIVVPPELITQMGYSGAWAVSHGVNPDDIVYYNHITVGNTTNLKGDFFTNMWGNTTSDIDVRLLLHGYNLVRWDGSNGMFTVDPSVVEGIVVTENDAPAVFRRVADHGMGLCVFLSAGDVARSEAGRRCADAEGVPDRQRGLFCGQDECAHRRACDG